jgi:eukaryotic-like serine/threonine-protein kinase
MAPEASQSEDSSYQAPRLRSEARSSPPFTSRDEAATEEATIVDPGIAERIAAEIAREQRLTTPKERNAAPDLCGPRLGEYRLVRLLASGDTSHVHLARREGVAGVARHLAIKTLRREHAQDPQRVRAFVDNARVLSALRHDNIARVFEIGLHDGTHYVAMEHLSGMSLRAVLQHCPSGLPMDFAITAIASCAEALHHARSTNARHERRHLRSVPSYFMACADGAVKLCQLGLAKLPTPTPTTLEFAYLAPEQARGDTFDARNDVFALGVMLYELITGVHPYLDPTDPAFPTARDRLLHADVDPPTRYTPQLAGELSAVVMTAMARDADRRYRDCREFAQALLKAAEGVGVSAGQAVVRRLMNQLLGTQPNARRAAGSPALIESSAIHDSDEITSVYIGVPALPPDPIANHAATASTSVTGSTEAPATASPLDHKAAPRQSPTHRSSPLEVLEPKPQPRPEVRINARALPLNAHRIARARAAVANPPDPQQEPRRAFQALVLLGAATTLVAGFALAVAASARPETTAEPNIATAAPNGVRRPAPTSSPAASTSDQPTDQQPRLRAEPPRQPPAEPSYQPPDSMAAPEPEMTPAQPDQPPDPPAYQPPDLPYQPDMPPAESPVPPDQIVTPPTDLPSDQPTDAPTDRPPDLPSDQPTDLPTDRPTDQPTDQPHQE